MTVGISIIFLRYNSYLDLLFRLIIYMINALVTQQLFLCGQPKFSNLLLWFNV